MHVAAINVHVEQKLHIFVITDHLIPCMSATIYTRESGWTLLGV
jgi:hypothetical protein